MKTKFGGGASDMREEHIQAWLVEATREERLYMDNCYMVVYIIRSAFR